MTTLWSTQEAHCQHYKMHLIHSLGQKWNTCMLFANFRPCTAIIQLLIYSGDNIFIAVPASSSFGLLGVQLSAFISYLKQTWHKDWLRSDNWNWFTALDDNSIDELCLIWACVSIWVPPKHFRCSFNRRWISSMSSTLNTKSQVHINCAVTLVWSY